MRIRVLIFSMMLALCCAAGCKTQYDLILESTDVASKYAAAYNYYTQKKYNKAAKLYESLSMLTKGTRLEDTVLYYWGLSNYMYKDYYTAETNLDNYIASFPLGVFAERANYLRIDCLYRETLRYELDQSPTYRALSEIDNYLREFPDTPYASICVDMQVELNSRLDRKAYEAALLYYNMEDYKAARVSFKNILKENADNQYREDILYYAAMSSFKYANMSIQTRQRERFLVFVDDYYSFVSELPQSKYRRELDVLYKRAQKSIERSVENVDRNNEKQYAKERSALLKAATEDRNMDFAALEQKSKDERYKELKKKVTLKEKLEKYNKKKAEENAVKQAQKKKEKELKEAEKKKSSSKK